VVVAAGGPALPPALREQLKVNGRLIMPVGSSERRQTLVQVTRTGADTYDQIDLGAVAFVPLIGEEGW
jgi:protein-L-isoaspartate O-methyltransferase